MARTIAEIQADMVTAKEAESGLSGLTSTSLTAIWRLLFYVCAVAIKVIEDLLDVHTEEIENRKLEITAGTTRWYGSESLLYQYGDSLEYVDTYVNEDGETVNLIGKGLYYNPITPANRVVDLSAADVINGVTVIKVARLVSGVAQPLSSAQLTGFTQYWLEKRFSGTSVSIISQDPDLLRAEYLITYDPQLLSSTGESLSIPGIFPVEDAITNFLQTYQDENFAGDMRVMRLTDAIQTASGVVNAVANLVYGKPDGGTYSDILAVSNQTYTATAGYMQIDPLYPLSTTLTYSA